MYLLNRKSVETLFQNKQIKSFKWIKVSQDRLICPTHVNKRKKKVLENFLFWCVTWSNLNGIPLKLLPFKNIRKTNVSKWLLCSRSWRAPVRPVLQQWQQSVQRNPTAATQTPRSRPCVTYSVRRTHPGQLLWVCGQLNQLLLYSCNYKLYVSLNFVSK